MPLCGPRPCCSAPTPGGHLRARLEPVLRASPSATASPAAAAAPAARLTLTRLVGHLTGLRDRRRFARLVVLPHHLDVGVR
ncbi:MAG: hypothetical protein ABUL57_02590, partial [Chloroflexota bacterium]